MLVYLALGGALGTVLRYGLQGWVQERVAGLFPLGTLVVNLTGSFLLGFLLRIGTESALISPELRAGLTVGFCGSLTTMSTFGYESVSLVADGQYVLAGLYGVGSLLGSLAGVYAGMTLAGRIL